MKIIHNKFLMRDSISDYRILFPLSNQLEGTRERSEWENEQPKICDMTDKPNIRFYISHQITECLYLIPFVFIIYINYNKF